MQYTANSTVASTNDLRSDSADIRSELEATQHALEALERAYRELERYFDVLQQGYIQACQRAAAARDADTQETEALRWRAAARERTIIRQLETIRDLREKTARWEQGDVTPQEAFIAAHPIADVIGEVVDLEPRTNGYRRYLAGRCPFCTQFSLVVYAYHNQFACYTCGAAGTVYDFVRLLRKKGSAA